MKKIYDFLKDTNQKLFQLRLILNQQKLEAFMCRMFREHRNKGKSGCFKDNYLIYLRQFGKEDGEKQKYNNELSKIN
ncbi:unnamed protein product [Paramecium pentaurelia]|uniref:Uncharacterized protein n=1 Tax=Paramecium pentaurelia TaxID=43138 RepID=A0A8S1X9Q6_9CILI|nr:unnamed protein product [Paramecium pentaurelia]